MWYGIGNTSLPNPSTIRIGLRRAGRYVLFSGAQDIGQGSSTILSQIAADALDVELGAIDLVTGDTDRTADAGKTSASTPDVRVRQRDAPRRRRSVAAHRDGRGPTSPRFPRTGTAASSSGRAATTRGRRRSTPTGRVSPTRRMGSGRRSPWSMSTWSSAPPYVRRIVAAHDVGRAINPMLVEGQIHGGIAQGLGFALMEEYVAGRTDNLHDYLIPTIGDIPPIETILVEDAEPAGPFGAKGVGEPALIPTAPAILGAIRHATGVRIDEVPATPDRVRAAIRG
jgi:CO/xanthine dehydrogenase Mo-binding subunit